MAFDSGVNAPGGVSFAPPLLSFGQFANWRPDDPYARVFKQQQQELNQQRIAAGQRQAALAQAFPNGLPTDPRTGAIDYGQIAATFAKFGDVGDAMNVLQNQPPPLSPMFGGQPSSGAPAPAGRPAAVSANPVPPAAPRVQTTPAVSPSGGTVSALASSVGAPDTVAQNVARALRVDPAAPLSDAQAARASNLLNGYATRQSGSGLARLQSAIFGQESGYGRNTQTSVTGARGDMQIEPDTFKQYASADESIDNPKDNIAVGNRILADYWKRYGGDPARAAVAYFSGPGNVAPAGSPTPWKKDKTDPTGKTVSSYVNDVLRKMGVGQLRQAMEPANPRVAQAFSAMSALPPSANSATPSPPPSTGTAPGSSTAPPQGGPALSRPSAPVAPQAAPLQQQPAPNGAPTTAPAQPAMAAQPPAAAAPTGPIGPQVPLPPDPRTGHPFTDPQEALLALRAEAARLSAYPRAQGQVQQLNAWAQQIEQSIKPIPIRSGETLIEPRTGQTIAQGTPANAANLALQRFLQVNPNATPQQIQAFVQSGRSSRSAIGMYMTKFAEEHPDATADDFKRAAQQYTTQTTAQNRFLSGPQGNTIRSLNVVVSHLQTMASLGDALKNGNIRAFNSFAQRFAEETGNPAPTNFDTAKQIVGAEVIKALGVAGAGSESERREAADAFNRARSPAQLAGAIDSARRLLVGQLQGLRRQYVASTGLPASSFDQMLEPETRSFFDQEDQGKSGKPNGQGWVQYPQGSIREIK